MTSRRSHRDTLAPTSRDFPCRNSCFLVFIFFLGVLTTIVALIFNDWEPVDRSNIGNVKATEFLSYGPIDVVYTWVNGTDPRWKREKEFWHKHWIASLTGQPLPVWGQDADVKGQDDSNADNRFRDNEELRYSLRSLEKYAPWVRHIYVVTDGQIPSWLDIESPKLSIVKHADIFANKSHLPVFSSPAIEWNLDNIPGLSDMFLYFNDDVFLGSPVRPEDFVSQAGVQKTYLAWEIPQCAARCQESSLANGRCDEECNVTACDYDMGDCGCDVNPLNGDVTCNVEKIESILEETPKPVNTANHLCQGLCYYYWLGNGLCNQQCNVSSCAFDGGDCRVVKEHDRMDRSRSNIKNNQDKDEEEENNRLSPLVKELWSADVMMNHTLVYVPLDVNAAYVNLTDAMGVNSSIWSASHDNEDLIRFASVYEMEMILLLVFGRDQYGNPMTSSVHVSIIGEDARKNTICYDFSIVRGNQLIETHSEVRNATELPGGMFTFQNTSIRPQRIRLPFGFRQATFRSVVPSIHEKDEQHVMVEDDNSLRDASIEDHVSRTIPQVEIFLPFNVTGKDLNHGDMLNLGWHMDLRLHDDEEDVDWSDHGVCQLQVPTKVALAARDTTTASASDQVIQDREEKLVDSERKRVASCRFAEENRGVLVTVRVLPTGRDRRSKEEENEEAPTPQAMDATASTVAQSKVATLLKEWTTRPQVSDGRICFYDSDRVDLPSQRYCFALGMGHYHWDKVAMVHKPTLSAPKPNVVYTPYQGNDPARLELVDRCIDTTERLVGFQPPTCELDEVPRLHVIDDAQVVDVRKQREEEGRALACEAQRRRLAQRETEGHPEEGEAVAHAGLRGRWGRLVRHLKSLLGLARLVEPASESLDAMAYANVCAPAVQDKPEAQTPRRTTAHEHLSKDTFGDSLRFVNQLFNRAFGKPTTSDRRRVPSHMPFLLQKSMIREIKAHWAHEVAATSAHRFRHPQDMQFSFTYFHYLINRAKVHRPTLDEIWRTYLDANRNGILDENEVLTAASLAHGDAPPDSFVTHVRECIQTAKRDKVRELVTAEGTVRLTETLTPHITVDTLAQCSTVRDALIANVRNESWVELMPETEVTFHMLSDNYRFAWKQLMGTRARRTKFVCINDDMKFPSAAVGQILHELFLSLWPQRSQFELPYHLKNRYAHLDEYKAALDRRYLAAGTALTLCLLAAFVFRAELGAGLGFATLARARAASASQLTHDLHQAQARETQEEGKGSRQDKHNNVDDSGKKVNGVEAGGKIM
ncbi:hypothetical protein PsorP6_007846 [Peronosclerospora sorghi]|uniref:Uncharacterized protein n=1 Tax=Peronosclerospora sorghi TaxID=230839 RepID=A0ACC0W9C2_9STRA|nr:hypothetical protein PsorP6_007846 [Peronosclerospora sorghi]